MTMAKVRAKIAARKVQAIGKRNTKRVDQALRAPNWREPKEDMGSACLSQVALYAAGHRKTINVTAR